MDDMLRQLVAQVPQAARLPLLICLVALAGWGVLYLFAMVATRPLPVRPGPATQDLPGEEPPAVVSVLANGWSITEDAAESTLLDLAARGYFELRQPDNDPRHTTIHVTAEDPQAAAAAAARQARVLRAAGGSQAPLTDYERQLMSHVKGIAVGGVVPLTALTFRDEGSAASWSSSFADAVLGDAKRRGLIARRVPPWVVTLLGVAAVAPSLSFSWFAWTADGGKDGRALFTGVIPWAVLSAVAGRQQGYRGTPAGRALAARWLGMREYLQVDESFAALPPSAVAVWDRYLAYGDALGVTHVCAAAIDLGMGSRRRVWSSFGGHWHQVRVRYPGRAARYGITTVRLVLGALVQLALGYFLLRARGFAAVSDAVNSPIGAVFLAVALGLLGRGAYRVVRAVTDSLGVRTLTGEVLWLADWKTRTKDDSSVTVTYYLAVDDGTADRTTAWALPAELRSQYPFRTGRPVELQVRPWSRRVITARAVAGAGAPADASPPATAASPSVTSTAGAVPPPWPGAAPSWPGAALPGVPLPVGPGPGLGALPTVAAVAAMAVETDATVPVPVPSSTSLSSSSTSSSAQELLSASELSAWFGLPLGAAQSLPMGPSTSAWSFRHERPGTTSGPARATTSGPVGRPADVVLVSAGRGTADAMALRQARRGTPVPGVGEEAYLVEQGAIARWGTVVVQVTAPPHLGVGSDALVQALQAAVVRVAKQRVG